MQSNILPDPRVKRAQEYLRRIEAYCASGNAPIYETWIDHSRRNQEIIELSSKNVNIIRAVRHAVRLLGGKSSYPRVVHQRFERDEQDEHHRVFTIHFVLNK